MFCVETCTLVWVSSDLELGAFWKRSDSFLQLLDAFGFDLTVTPHKWALITTLVPYSFLSNPSHVLPPLPSETPFPFCHFLLYLNSLHTVDVAPYSIHSCFGLDYWSLCPTKQLLKGRDCDLLRSVSPHWHLVHLHVEEMSTPSTLRHVPFKFDITDLKKNGFSLLCFSFHFESSTSLTFLSDTV